MAMLHFLYNCLSGNTSQKKMFFKIHILYIEEGPAVYGWSQETTLTYRSLIEKTCVKYNFTYTILPLEQIYDVKLEALNDRATDLDSNPKYKQFADNLPTNQTLECEDIETKRNQLLSMFESLEPSFAADIALYLKKWLISNFALTYNFKRVLLATSGHKIATQLLG